MKKRVISLIMAFVMVTLLIPTMSFSAEKNGTIKVTITKTDIKADSVFNTSGYGSIRYNYDEESFETAPRAALVDRNGKILFPYKDTWLRYYVDNDIVSLVSGDIGSVYTRYYLYEPINETQTTDPVEFYHLDSTVAFSGDYWDASPVQDGYAFVTSVSGAFDSSTPVFTKSYLIDSTGQVVLELGDEFTEIIGNGGGYISEGYSTRGRSAWFSEGVLGCCLLDYGDNEYYIQSLYYMDITGKKVITLDTSEYNDCGAFSDGLALVKSAKNDKMGAIDKTGKLVIPCEYDTGTGFNDGVSGVSKDGKYGYINAKNETVIPFEYDGAYGAGDGLAAVVKNGKCGLVDYNNNVVVPLEYDDISTFDTGVAYAIKDGYLYIITESGANSDGAAKIFSDLDCDEQVTSSDALTVLRMSVGLTTYDDETLIIADIDNDGQITSADALELLRFSVGLSKNEKLGKTV